LVYRVAKKKFKKKEDVGIQLGKQITSQSGRRRTGGGHDGKEGEEAKFRGQKKKSLIKEGKKMMAINVSIETRHAEAKRAVGRKKCGEKKWGDSKKNGVGLKKNLGQRGGVF